MSTPATPDVDGTLSRWVSHVQQQHSGRDGAAGGGSFGFGGGQSVEDAGRHAGRTNGDSAGASTADELEEELRRAREERLKRRSQLGGTASSNAPPTPRSAAVETAAPFSSSSHSNPGTPSLSGEETLRKLLGERGITSPSVERSVTMPSPSADTTLPAFAPAKKANTLLDRYGGAMGPTGVARPGSSDSPASLASFMGGKASGPRLGKLAGDGRSAPPEASQIHQTRHALPGLAQKPSSAANGSTPLASFLEARASGKSGEDRSPSPTKTSYSPPKASYSPPKPQTSFATPLNSTGSRWPPNVSTSSQAATVPARPLSPIRVPNAQGGTAKMAVPETQGERVAAFSAGRYDASTSPLKEGDLPESKVLSPKFKAPAQTNAPSLKSSGALSPGSIVHSPTADALSRFAPPSQSPATSPIIPQEQNLSPAFIAAQQSTERMPTASLTRLRSKKMVEQRIREAQERSNSQESVSPARSPAEEAGPGTSPWGGANRPANNAATALPARSQPLSPPAHFGQALPGFGGQREAGTQRNLYAVNRKSPEEEAAAHSAPVRLPGMGAAASPFEGRQLAEAQAENEHESKPLEPLMKGRAKPKRAVNTAREVNHGQNQTVSRPAADVVAYEEPRISREAFSNAKQAFNDQRPPSPAKCTPDLSLRTEMVHDRQDSLPAPDSAAKIADSTAALEALLEGRSVKTPPAQTAPLPIEKLARRDGTLKIAKNRNTSNKIDQSALSTSLSRQNGLSQKAISLEVVLIKSDGSTDALQGEEAATLYEAETQVITHRYKDSATSAVISTAVYARVGRASGVVTSTKSCEAGKLMEFAQRYRTPVIDARQGRESAELVHLLGGCLVTREGDRQRFDRSTTCMYQVRGMQGCLYIDQVDMLTGSLCSAYSAIVQLMGDVFVWHGIGATKAVRQGAVHYASKLRESKSQISEYEEGFEDELFWTCFEKGSPYSSAWHHRFLPLLGRDQLKSRLFGIQYAGSSAKLVEHSPFSALDVRRDGVFLLQLPMEIYVLVGPDARSHRHSIAAMLEAGSTLARQLAHQRGPQIMSAPIHVVVFPSLVPREVRSAFRYWHDEHLNGKRWQRMQLRMNVWEKREAMQQMERNEYSLAELDDDLFLPVGVGLDDIKGIDI